MSPYEYVLSYYLLWKKTLHLTFSEIDDMDFDFLLDLVSVQNKIDFALDPDNQVHYIDEILK